MDKIDFQKGKRKLLRVIFGRTVLLFTALLLQAGILLFFMFKLAEYLTYYYWISYFCHYADLYSELGY